MSNPIIPEATIVFLKNLKENNNKECYWFFNFYFYINKSEYQKQLESMVSFADGLLEKLSIHDVIETASGKKSLHRIYRDTRFSKEKIPYKNNWSGGFSRAT